MGLDPDFAAASGEVSLLVATSTTSDTVWRGGSEPSVESEALHRGRIPVHKRRPRSNPQNLHRLFVQERHPLTEEEGCSLFARFPSLKCNSWCPPPQNQLQRFEGPFRRGKGESATVPSPPLPLAEVSAGSKALLLNTRELIEFHPECLQPLMKV